MQADSFGQKGKVQEHAGSPVRRLARGVAILLRSPLRRIWQRPIQGVFYDGQLWDACSLVERLVARARASILLIDNWVGVETLDLLAKKRKGVSVTVVTSELKTVGASRVPRLRKRTLRSPTRSTHPSRCGTAKSSMTASLSLTTGRFT